MAFIWRFYTDITLCQAYCWKTGVGETEQKTNHYTIVAIGDQSRIHLRIQLTVLV